MSAAANGREEPDFVAGLQGSVPGSKFLIAGGHQRWAELAELGLGGRTGLEKILDQSAIAKLNGLFGRTAEFAETAEIEDFDGHYVATHFT
jgi:hypothetical protein